MATINFERKLNSTAYILRTRSGNPWDACPNIYYPKIAYDLSVKTMNLPLEEVVPYKNIFEMELASCKGLADGYISGVTDIQNQTKDDSIKANMLDLITFFKKGYAELFKEVSIAEPPEPTIMNTITTLKESYNLPFLASWWELR